MPIEDRRVISRYIAIAINSGILLLMRFGTIALLSHWMKENDFSVFIYLYSTALLLALVSDFGLRTSLFVEVGRTGQLKAEYAKRLIAFRFQLGLVSFAIMATWAFIYLADSHTWLARVSLALLFGAFSANSPAADIALHAIRGKGRALHEATVKILESVTVLLIAVLCLSSSINPLYVIAAWVASGIARLGYSHVTAFGRLKFLQRLRSAQAWELFSQQFDTWLLIFVNTFSMRFVILISPFFVSDKGVIFVSISLMLVQASQVLSTSIAFQLFGFNPARSKTNGSRPAFAKVIAGLALMGLITSFVIFLFSRSIGALLNVDLNSNETALLLMVLSLPLVLVNDFLRFMVVFYRFEKIFNLVVLSLISAATGTLFVLKWLDFGLGLTEVILAFTATQFLQATLTLFCLKGRKESEGVLPSA